jgi:phospholipid/cholesterol/gamma-HCH transport system permease protein
MSLTATTQTRTSPAPHPSWSWPLRFISDLGGMALLLGRAARAGLTPRRDSPPLLRAILANAGWMLGMGLPLVGLVHVSFGSFLTMQAYFGATFTEAAGIVVGLGLIRNIAPLLSGFILAGLIAAKITSDLRGGPSPGLDDPRSLPDREVSRGLRPDSRPVPTTGRIALARLVAAALVGPVLSIWGAFVGTAVGVLVARSMLGQAPEIFLGKIAGMLDTIDVAGLAVKGVCFAGGAALIATYEGLRPESQGGPDAFRAALRSVVMILFLNFTWFNLVYLAGNPFGPNVVSSGG